MHALSLSRPVARLQVHEEVVVDAGVALIALALAVDRTAWLGRASNDVAAAQKDSMDRARHRPRRVVAGAPPRGGDMTVPLRISPRYRRSGRGPLVRVTSRGRRPFVDEVGPSAHAVAVAPQPAALVYTRSEADPASRSLRAAMRLEMSLAPTTAPLGNGVARASLQAVSTRSRDGPEVHWQSVLRLEAFHASGRSLPLGLLQKIHSPSDLRALRTIQRLAAHHAPAHSLR